MQGHDILLPDIIIMAPGVIIYHPMYNLSPDTYGPLTDTWPHMYWSLPTKRIYIKYVDLQHIINVKIKHLTI